MLHSTTSEDHLYQQSKRRIDAKASSENNCINNVCIIDAFFLQTLHVPSVQNDV